MPTRMFFYINGNMAEQKTIHMIGYIKYITECGFWSDTIT